jgi:hypothetical protein
MCGLCSVFCLGYHIFYLFDIFLQVENIDPLVHHAIAAASALPDLRGKINVCIKLIATVRFVIDLLVHHTCFDNFQILHYFLSDCLIYAIVLFCHRIQLKVYY